MVVKRVNTVVAPRTVDTARRAPEAAGAAVLETHGLAVHQHAAHGRPAPGRRARAREDARVHERCAEQGREGPEHTGAPARRHRTEGGGAHGHRGEHERARKRAVGREDGTDRQHQERQVGRQHAAARTEHPRGGRSCGRTTACACHCRRLDVHHRDHHGVAGRARRRLLCLCCCRALRHLSVSRNAHGHLLPRQKCGRPNKNSTAAKHETRLCAAHLLGNAPQIRNTDETSRVEPVPKKKSPNTPTVSAVTAAHTGRRTCWTSWRGPGAPCGGSPRAALPARATASRGRAQS